MSWRKPICNAPFANIYIDGKGNVTPCCFNRDDVFGNIYNDDVEKIWKSSNAFAVRRALLNHKFPKGCRACEKALQAKNYYNSGIFTYSKLNYKKLKIQAVDFELSYWCNLSCVMCNLHTKDYELTVEQENELLEKINPLLKGLKKARFYGGEPLLIPAYRKIWQKIVEITPKCNILIQTNGMLLDDDFKALTQKGNFTFNISLDSLDAENASKIRRGSNIECVLSNIRQFKKLSRHDMSLAVTPMRMNWKEIPELIRFANKESIHVNFNEMIHPGKLSLWTYNANELHKIYSYFNLIKFVPKSIIGFYNILKYNNLKNYIKYLKANASLRPEYSEEEIKIWSEKIYNEILKQLPQIAFKDKQTLLQKIQSLLFSNRAEEVLLYINNTSSELLEFKINEIIENE